MYTRVLPYPLRVNFDIRTDPLGGYAGVQIFSQPYGLLAQDEGITPRRNRFGTAVFFNSQL